VWEREALETHGLWNYVLCTNARWSFLEYTFLFPNSSLHQLGLMQLQTLTSLSLSKTMEPCLKPGLHPDTMSALVTHQCPGLPWLWHGLQDFTHIQKLELHLWSRDSMGLQPSWCNEPDPFHSTKIIQLPICFSKMWLFSIFKWFSFVLIDPLSKYWAPCLTWDLHMYDYRTQKTPTLPPGAPLARTTRAFNQNVKNTQMPHLQNFKILFIKWVNK
jgi:hypothetical protein